MVAPLCNFFFSTFHLDVDLEKCSFSDETISGVVASVAVARDDIGQTRWSGWIDFTFNPPLVMVNLSVDDSVTGAGCCSGCK